MDTSQVATSSPIGKNEAKVSIEERRREERSELYLRLLVSSF